MSLSVDGSYSHCFGVLPEQNAYKTSLLLWGRYQAVQWGELLVNIGCILISVILSLFICNITILTYIINDIIIVGDNIIIIRITTMIIIIAILFITTIMNTCISSTCGN